MRAHIREMVDRAWIDRFRGFCYIRLCKVWMSIVGQRPLLAGTSRKIRSGWNRSGNGGEADVLTTRSK